MVVRKTLPTQLRCGSEPKKELFREVGNYGESERTGFMKPVGGLWTSTWDTAFEDGWPQWCIGEEFNLDHLSEAWLLEPVECNVIELFGFDQCHDFMVRYAKELYQLPKTELRHWDSDPYNAYARAYEHFDTPSMACPVWTEVVKDADCVRLLTPYAMDVRLGPYLCFNGWDCESTIWLRWRFSGAAKHVDLSKQIKAMKRHEYA